MRVQVAVNILEIFAVIFLVDRSINVLMSEELEDEWQVVRVQQKLGQVFVFEYVCAMIRELVNLQ